MPGEDHQATALSEIHKSLFAMSGETCYGLIIIPGLLFSTLSVHIVSRGDEPDPAEDNL